MDFVAGTVVLLVLWNSVGNRVAGFARWYLPLNLGLATVLVAVARVQGLSWAALGLDPADAPRGLLVGGALAVPVALLYAVALAVPRLRPLLRDRRVAPLDGRAVAFVAVVRIPLGTVVLEEVAFRGVLLSAWSAEQPLPLAVLGSSAVFGLWHVVPTRLLLDANGVTEPRHRRAATAGAVVGTTLAGAALCLLRVWTGSLAAPAVVHVATNTFGVVAAALALRLRETEVHGGEP